MHEQLVRFTVEQGVVFIGRVQENPGVQHRETSPRRRGAIPGTDPRRRPQLPTGNRRPHLHNTSCCLTAETDTNDQNLT